MRSSAIGLAALIVLAVPARAQNVQLRGRVVDETAGVAVANALVRLQDLERYTFATAQGWFRFENVPAGRHRIEIQQLGYARSEQWVVADGETDVTVRVAQQPIVLDAIVAHSGFLDARAKRWRLGSSNPPPYFTWDRSDILQSGFAEPTTFLRKVSSVKMERCGLVPVERTCVVRPFYMMAPGTRGTIAGRGLSTTRVRALDVLMFRPPATKRLDASGRPAPPVTPTVGTVVFVDDQAVPGGLDALDSLYTMSTMWRVETYGYRGERGIRFYTLDYTQRIATGEIRPALSIPVSDLFEPLPSWLTPPRRR